MVAADVYAVAPHAGRGGWTWYTGSAGWMYRLIIESLLGLRLEVDGCASSPACRATGRLHVRYRYRETTYAITVLQSVAPGEPPSISLDGAVQPGGVIHLADDHVEHKVEVHLAGGGA